MSELDEVYERIAGNMKKLRARKGWSQAQMAQVIHFAQPVISEIENKKKSLTLEQIAEICSALNVSIKEFLFFTTDELNSSYSTSTATFYNNANFFPISKIAGLSFFIYYLSEKELESGKIQVEIQEMKIDIQHPASKYSANALLLYSGTEGEVCCEGRAVMDCSYAYLLFQNTQYDFYLSLSFYYYRKSQRKRYYGGVGLMQSIDKPRLPVSQYFLISQKSIPQTEHSSLKAHLMVSATKKTAALSKQSISSRSIMRLTKKRDNKAYTWLAGLLDYPPPKE